jgi:hypothetical protein
MKLEQRALRFHCRRQCLVGIVDVPERPLVRGMLVLAGGPSTAPAAIASSRCWRACWRRAASR